MSRLGLGFYNGEDIEKTRLYKIVHEGFEAFKKTKRREAEKADAKQASQVPQSTSKRESGNANDSGRSPCNEGARADGTSCVTVVPSQ